MTYVIKNRAGRYWTGGGYWGPSNNAAVFGCVADTPNEFACPWSGGEIATREIDGRDSATWYTKAGEAVAATCLVPDAGCQALTREYFPGKG